MSLHWDIGCKDCEARAKLFEINHGDQRLVEFCQHASKIFTPQSAITITRTHKEMLEAQGSSIVALQYLADLNVRASDGLYYAAVVLRFFKEHAGHNIMPIDEYDRWLNQCTLGYECPCCKHRQNCKLPRDHEGRHSPAFV